MLDFNISKIAEKYGGWPRILDPGFVPSESLYAEFESAGFSRVEFDRKRSKSTLTERDYLLLLLAQALYQRWRICPVYHDPKLEQLIWRYQNIWAPKMFFDKHRGRMTELGISCDDVARRILSDDKSFPPPDFSMEDPDPDSPAGVPRKPRPELGGANVVLPLPELEEPLN